MLALQTVIVGLHDECLSSTSVSKAIASSLHVTSQRQHGGHAEDSIRLTLCTSPLFSCPSHSELLEPS
jgi:hypothetical protein